MGKLNQQLCRRLQIEKLKTSAYHPQTNGCLERWHGTLVPMIKKSIENKLNWEKQICLPTDVRRIPTQDFLHLKSFMDAIYGVR